MDERLTLEEVMSLASSQGGRRVSLYMPAERAGPETRQNPIRWKNLIKEAEGQLVALTDRPEDARRMLDEARALEDDNDFWQHQDAGLAAFIDEAGMRTVRLPLSVGNQAVVADEFHVKPLLPLFFENGPFYLLKLSQNAVRLYQGQRFALNELDVPDLPRSIDDALWADQMSGQQQFHTVNTGVSGRGDAIFHGNGDDAQSRHKEDLKRFFDMVDHAVTRFLTPSRAPLVVASVEYLQPIYREANSYGNLLDDGVSGSPEALSEDELGRRAWQIVEAYYDEEQRQVAERFGNQIGTGLASADLEQIVMAASEGRIDTLWVSREDDVWGEVADDGAVRAVHEEKQPGDRDLIDLAATRTLVASGRVFAVEPHRVPSGTAMAAILRY
ncbi:MAG: hypothetical protein AB7P33_05605 [Dehalococcoidia bacterium]